MKRSLIPVAAAVTFALAAGSASALNAPGYNASAPTNGAGSAPIILSIFDPTTNFSEAISLNYSYADVVGGALTPDSASGPFMQHADPTGGSGQVLQLDFGVVPQYLATFGANDASASFWVAGASGAATQLSASTKMLVTQPLTASLPAGTFPTVGTINTAMTKLGQWLPGWGSGNPTVDKTGSLDSNNTGLATWGASLGNAFLSQPASAAVGSALNMYLLDKAGKVSAGLPAVVSEFANSTGAGYWFLDSTTGDLTWNVPFAVSQVPLPAAAWLLISGLASLGAVGRRRRAAEAV
ncbi:MAG TPA: VPLPA-CTERM sorting domain-containing protein [Steroidobacteraceae bacterium]